MVTFPAAEHHHFLVGTKLYYLLNRGIVCEQLAQSCYLIVLRPGVEPTVALDTQSVHVLLFHQTSRICGMWLTWSNLGLL